MHRYEFLLASAKPSPVAKYNAIFREFDVYIWVGIATTVVAATMWLIMAGTIWSQLAFAASSRDFVYEGEYCPYPSRHILHPGFYTGITITTSSLLQQSLLHSWFGHTPGSKRGMLAIWLLGATFVSMSYKSTLLSALIRIEYRRPVDTIKDLFISGLPFLLPKGTAPIKLVATDPRPVVRMIYNRSVLLYEFNGTIPAKIIKK